MRRTIVHTTLPIAAAAMAALAVGSAPAAASAELARAGGTFASGGPAYTYSPPGVPSSSLVPSGATAVVRVIETPAGSTVTTLQVRGFPADTPYTVHAHVGSCSSNSGTSGGHYQDSVGGLVNAENEVWLGFTTNPAGNGRAQSVVEWHFREGAAHSITFHYGGTPRVACLPVAF